MCSIVQIYLSVAHWGTVFFAYRCCSRYCFVCATQSGRGAIIMDK